MFVGKAEGSECKGWKEDDDVADGPEEEASAASFHGDRFRVSSP